MPKNDKLIFFLDDNCIMCNKFCHFLSKRLENIEFHSIFSPASNQLFKLHGIEITPDINTSYLWNGDKFLAKSESFFYLMSNLKYPYKAINWISFLQNVGADLVYQIIQRNRHKIFVRNSCPISQLRIVPDKDILEIFNIENNKAN